MSEHSTPEERTELPTDKRMEQLREEGQLALSTDLVQVMSLTGGFLVLLLVWQWIAREMEALMRQYFLMIGQQPQFTIETIHSGLLEILRKLVPPVFTIGLSVAVVAALAVMLQTKWNIKKKKIDIKITQLNPINGIKRIFSVQGVVTTLKAIFKLTLILPIGYYTLKTLAPEMIMLMHLSVREVLQFLGLALKFAFWRIMYVLIALAIFDYFWSRHQWLKTSKMTKDEVKDERKSIEGDENTRRRIQSKGLSRIAQRIRESVPQADVVVTNPTHYAVALKYDRERMNAPLVVAKGRGFLAQRIKEIAKLAGVPMLERRPLARALYDSTEVGSEVPHDLYRAVAEVLAYVYRLKNPYAYANGR